MQVRSQLLVYMQIILIMIETSDDTTLASYQIVSNPKTETVRPGGQNFFRHQS